MNNPTTASLCAAGAALVETITNAVYEALMSPVATNLKALPGLKEWTAAAPGQGGGVMTGAGECISIGMCVGWPPGWVGRLAGLAASRQHPNMSVLSRGVEQRIKHRTCLFRQPQQLICTDAGDGSGIPIRCT
jgi:hypothetical protein